MCKITNGTAVKFNSTTFSDVACKESDVEELLRKNIYMICDEEEPMLIVGKQVRNAQRGISDLTANCLFFEWMKICSFSIKFKS